MFVIPALPSNLLLSANYCMPVGTISYFSARRVSHTLWVTTISGPSGGEMSGRVGEAVVTALTDSSPFTLFSANHVNVKYNNILNWLVNCIVVA